jgi:hypothetical protein
LNACRHLLAAGIDIGNEKSFLYLKFGLQVGAGLDFRFTIETNN